MLKRILIIPLLFLFVQGCKDDPSPIVGTTPPEELFMRDDAYNTLIPLLNMYKWSYKINMGNEEKPIGPIKHLIEDDAIEYMRILPVREYDNNDGWGKYEYMALCYITTNNKVFFYMRDKIYIGRYLQADNNGFESVMWDYELPTYCNEFSSNYFVLNRNVSSPVLDEDYLHEMAGYYTINIQINSTDYREYSECKLFEYKNKRNSSSESIRVNKFYFKQGKGLIRYQQFALSPTDSTLVILYEQDLMEDF